jgi:4a-hydroxytetrahydrobiopterin dehydratase
MAFIDDLSAARCEPCEGGVEPLTEAEAKRYLKQLGNHWALSTDAKSIFTEFRFPGFNRTMGFVNAVAWIASSEGHHPDLEVGYGRCLVTYTTHSISGLSSNDFICAVKIDALLT